MKRIPLLVIVIAAQLPTLLVAAERQLAEEQAMHTPEYWAQVRREERELGIHANADEVGYTDTDAGMWETGE